MKKICYLVIMLLFMSGCSNKIDINKNNIIAIRYQNIVLNSKDYDKLMNNLNNINFSKRKINDKYTKELKITTSSNLYILKFSDKDTLKYTVNNKNYYSKNKKTISSILKHLNSLEKKYSDKDFFSFKELNKYKENKNDKLIKLDNVNQYFKLITSIPIKNLSIHKVERKNDQYSDIDYIYNNNNINSNKFIIRMNAQKDYSNYRISFTNIYNMNVSIIPIIDIEKETGEIKYIINYNLISK